MAQMIPEKPREFNERSMEGMMFEALESLPDDYYVVHSYSLLSTKDNIVRQNETDFIIFHPQKGIICMEAKAGAVRYRNGAWYYQSGELMAHDGPFNQASRNKFILRQYIEESRFASVLDHCKFLHAVWFPSISENTLKAMVLPPEADIKLILPMEALDDPQKYIDRIFSLEVPGGIKTQLREMETNRIIREFLCPQFDIVPAQDLDAKLKKTVFHRLLKEQANILNFLTEQRTAIINGVAGTGKTLIAKEKAERHARLGERVLFLCYNVQLKKHLERNNTYENIDYYTISGLACKLCNTSVPSFSKLNDVLLDMYISKSFPYQHVIIDEGQDFGIDNIEEEGILNLLKEIVDDRENGSFYVFYDKLQKVHSKKLPAFIEEADCKLTLYRNCRNTENIAITSMKPLSEKKPRLIEGCIKGVPATMHFCKSKEGLIKRVEELAGNYELEGFKSIVILTVKTERDSILSDSVQNGKFQGKYPFTTCRKFKGLEADIVLLVDVDQDAFEGDNALLFYVGTSRARLRLDILTMLSKQECEDVLQDSLKFEGKIKKPERELATALNATARISE